MKQSSPTLWTRSRLSTWTNRRYCLKTDFYQEIRLIHWRPKLKGPRAKAAAEVDAEAEEAEGAALVHGGAAEASDHEAEEVATLAVAEEVTEEVTEAAVVATADEVAETLAVIGAEVAAVEAGVVTRTGVSI